MLCKENLEKGGSIISLVYKPSVSEKTDIRGSQVWECPSIRLMLLAVLKVRGLEF